MNFEELLEQNKGDIVKLAQRYSNVSKISDIDDFISVGMYGFYKALSKYDETKGACIRTFAYKYAKQEMWNVINSETRAAKRDADVCSIEAFGWYSDNLYTIEYNFDNDMQFNKLIELAEDLLTPAQYNAFYKSIVLDKEFIDISKEMNVSRQAIKSAFDCGIKKLKKNNEFMRLINDLHYIA